MAPKSLGHRAVGDVAAAGGDDLGAAAGQAGTRERDQPTGAQVVLDQVAGEVAPAHALDDQLALHQLVAHGQLARAFDQKVVARLRVAGGVADNALHLGLQPIRSLAGWRIDEAGRRDRRQRHREQIDEFQPRVRLVDVVQDQVGLAIEQPLPGSGNGLEVQVQTRGRVVVEEPAKQGQRVGQRAEVADDDAQLAFLAQAELGRVPLQRLQLVQERLGLVMERAPGVGQPGAIAAAVEQRQAELRLQVADRGEHGRVGAPQPCRGGLEPAFADHGVEALQLLQSEAAHLRNPIVLVGSL